MSRATRPACRNSQNLIGCLAPASVRALYPPTGISTSAGLVSNVVDLVKFDAAINAHSMIKSTTQAQAWKASVSTEGETLPVRVGLVLDERVGAPARMALRLLARFVFLALPSDVPEQTRLHPLGEQRCAERTVPARERRGDAVRLLRTPSSECSSSKAFRDGRFPISNGISRAGASWRT